MPAVVVARMSRSPTACRLLIVSVGGLAAACTSIDGPMLDESPAQQSAELEPIVGGRYVVEPDQDVVGELQVMRTNYEDTFIDIGRAYGLGFDELVAANPDVDPWLPGADTAVVLPTRFVLPEAPRKGLVLNIAAKRLFYFPPVVDGEPRVVETYPIGIGREGWETPTGSTTVVSKARDPVWFVPASVRREHAAAGDPLPRQVPPGPDNPLGSYVLGLGLPGYLIHGTNKPAGVGMRVSHGCVRLFPENIESLYERVDIGVPVRIVNQPFLFGRLGDDLVFEAHAPLDDDERDLRDSLIQQARSGLVGYADELAVLDEERVQRLADDARGFPVSVISWRPDTPATLRAARPVVNIIEQNRVADQSFE